MSGRLLIGFEGFVVGRLGSFDVGLDDGCLHQWISRVLSPFL